MRQALLSRRPAVALLATLATAFTLRAIRGYRSFPSIDDFVYVPLARAALHPELYARDTLLDGFVVHTPVWTWVLWLSERWLELPVLFWVLTLLLSVATVGAADRLLAALGGGRHLLPLLCWIALSGRVNGIGRGQHEGMLGDAFHVQWLALCLLLWGYVAFVRRRPILCGGLLGLAAVAHPVVAAHGAVVVAVAVLVARAGIRSLVVTGVSALVVSAPVSLPLLGELVTNRPAAEVSGAELVQSGYLFRTPHEFTFAYTMAGEALFVALAALSGIAGAGMLRRVSPERPPLAAFGLLCGHLLLLALAVAVHGPWSAGSWLEGSTLPYLLHLTRTSPVVLVLGPALALAAVVRGVGKGPLRPALLAAVGILLLFPLSPGVILFLGLAAVVYLAGAAWHGHAVAAVVLALWAGSALTSAVARDEPRAVLPPEERELFDWAARETPVDALFIVPPGFQQFRTYAWRGVYVDFKVFPSTTPRLIPEWRRRLELVAGPDSVTLARDGWPGMAAWDSSYAVRNTPGRIAGLLRRAQAEYFVLDLAAAGPAPTPDEVASAGLVPAFSNERFRVYRPGARPGERPIPPAAGTG